MAGAPLGNKNGAKERRWREAILRAIARRANGSLDHGMDKLAEKVVSMADRGDKWAIEEIACRSDGRHHQSVGLEGPDGGDLEMKHVIVFGTAPLPPKA